MPSLEYRQLSGSQKAAIMILSLGEEGTAKVWELLDDEEIKEVSQTMANLGWAELIAQLRSILAKSDAESGICCNHLSRAFERDFGSALVETLFHELADTKIGVSALCPGYVPTRIAEAERNRPEGLRTEDAPEPRPMPGGWSGETPALQAIALAPEAVAEQVVQAVRDDRFWVLTHATAQRRVAARYESLTRGENPCIETGTG